MRPLMLFGVLYVVFTKVFKFGGGIKDYPMVLLLNIVCFTFFTEATTLSVASVVQRESLVRKMHFPRVVIPLSVVLTAGLNLLVNLVAVFVFMLAYGIAPRWTWLLLPLGLIPLVLLALGVAMLLSALFVRFRDVQPIWSVLSTVLFYGTPVLYVVDILADRPGWKRAVLCNPIGDVLEQLRHWVIDPGAPTAVSAIGGWTWFLVPVAVLVVVCALGAWVFSREAPRIAESL